MRRASAAISSRSPRYARQFLERIEKPEIDEVHGIAPAIAIRQRNTARTPRSTVGTSTEVYDYLRLLFARVGVTICRKCGCDRSEGHSRPDCRHRHAVAARHEVLCPLSIAEKPAARSTCRSPDRPETARLQPDLPNRPDISITRGRSLLLDVDFSKTAHVLRSTGSK